MKYPFEDDEDIKPLLKEKAIEYGISERNVLQFDMLEVLHSFHEELVKTPEYKKRLIEQLKYNNINK